MEKKEQNGRQACSVLFQTTVFPQNGLDTWVEQQEVVYISVFRNNLLLYDSAYSANDQNDEDNPAYYGSAHLYSIQFSDGPANVYVIGFCDDHYIVYVTVISICLAAITLLLSFSPTEENQLH